MYINIRLRSNLTRRRVKEALSQNTQMCNFSSSHSFNFCLSSALRIINSLQSPCTSHLKHEFDRVPSAVAYAALQWSSPRYAVIGVLPELTSANRSLRTAFNGAVAAFFFNFFASPTQVCLPLYPIAYGIPSLWRVLHKTA